MPIPICPEDGSQPFQAALAALPSATDPKTHYEQQVFPWAAKRLFQDRANNPGADLLIVPVGTQPYSPLLACLATTAGAIALLHSEKTLSFAARVSDSLRSGLALLGADRPAIEYFNLGDGTSGADICNAVDAALMWASDPWADQVTIDVTGGKKASTATLGAIAGLRGFRTTYIDGRPAHPPYFTEERLVHLANVSDLLGHDLRIAATALVRAGAFEAAAQHLNALAEAIIVGPAVGWLTVFSEAMQKTNAHQRLDALALLSEQLPNSAAKAVITAATENSDTTSLGSAFVDALVKEGAWR